LHTSAALANAYYTDVVELFFLPGERLLEKENPFNIMALKNLLSYPDDRKTKQFNNEHYIGIILTTKVHVKSQN